MSYSNDGPDMDLGNAFKPVPLQPASLVRTDDDGMYVAVGGGKTALGLGGSPMVPGRPQRVVDNSPSPGGNRGGGPAYADGEETPDGGAMDTQRGSSTASGGTRGNMMAANRDGRAALHSQAVDYSTVRPRSAPPDGVMNHDGENREAWKLANFAKSHEKQPWLAGWTTSCCDHKPTCADAFLCPWCVHGMQWRKLHETAKERREKASRNYTDKNQRSEKKLDDILEAKKSRHVVVVNNDDNEDEDGDDDDSVDEDGNKKKKKKKTKIVHVQPAKQWSYYQNVENDNGYGNQGCMGRCCDRCDQIDWLCCAGSFILDVISLPLLATPFGSAAAQFHIRSALRRKYNIVPAPGSMTYEEDMKRRDDAALTAMKRDNRKKEKEARDEASRKFGDRFPNAKEQSEEARNSSSKSRRRNNNNGGRYEQDDEDEEDHHQNQQQQQQQQQENDASTTASKTNNGDDDQDDSMCDDETKELLVAWCCSLCSAAQVQRELSLRQEFPGGFFSRPLKPRRLEDVALPPHAGVADAMRELDAISPPKQRQPWMDEQSTVRGESAPPSRHLAPPPPTPHEGRYQGEMRGAPPAQQQGDGEDEEYEERPSRLPSAHASPISGLRRNDSKNSANAGGSPRHLTSSFDFDTESNPRESPSRRVANQQDEMRARGGNTSPKDPRFLGRRFSGGGGGSGGGGSATQFDRPSAAAQFDRDGRR